MTTPPPSKLARARALLSAVVAEADETTVSGAALGACIPPGLMQRIRAELAELERARGASEQEQTPFAPDRLTNDESDPDDRAARLKLDELARIEREHHPRAELGALTMTNETLDEARERWQATAVRFALRDIRDEMDRAAALADALNDGSPLPAPTAGDLERWRVAAAELPGPLGRAFLITLGEVERQRSNAERFEALLRRVRCYSVVDTMGNPRAASSSARMLGIESDIDDALEGRPERAIATIAAEETRRR